jgi:hypothetical protein
MMEKLLRLAVKCTKSGNIINNTVKYIHMTEELAHLQNLKSVSLITMPRGGSEYLQSLLDGHPEILIFILNFPYFSVYTKNSDCVASDASKINPSDFIYEFVGKEICRLKGIYHKTERLDRLGINGDQALNVDLQIFIDHFLSILGNEEASIKNIFLSLYGAYHLSVGRDIFKTKVIFHHAHWQEEAMIFQKYFPSAKLICCIRDPRASIKSMVYNCKNNYYGAHHYNGYYGALEIIEAISSFASFNYHTDDKKTCLFVKLEDLPKRDILEEVINYIGVKSSSSVFISTWAGLEWRGDRVSGKAFDPSEEWSANRSYNNWRENLSYIDKIILESTFLQFLIDYQYIERRRGTVIIFIKKIITLIFLVKPLTLEYDFFSIPYVIKKLKNYRIPGLLHVLSTPYFYFRVRVIFFRALLNLNKVDKKFMEK